MAFLQAAAKRANSFTGKRSNLPYLLLLPGMLFLLLFFILPILNLAATSTQTPAPSGEIGSYIQTFHFSNYVNAFLESRDQFARSFIYATLATVLALAIAYPLAYAIAFKSGRLKNLLVVLVVAPFFTSFLLRTIAWKQILGRRTSGRPTSRTSHYWPADNTYSKCFCGSDWYDI